MSDHVYKHIEITGTSSDSIEDAVDGALKKASDTVRNMRWFEVVGLRGSITWTTMMRASHLSARATAYLRLTSAAKLMPAGSLIYPLRNK